MLGGIPRIDINKLSIKATIFLFILLSIWILSAIFLISFPLYIEFIR